MRYTPSVTEVARNFTDYINRVAFRGERFVLMRGKRPVAELRPVSSGKRLQALPELLASLPHLSEREAEALAEDLAAGRSELTSAGTPIGPHDLWLAAAAVAHGLVLVTANLREFQRVPGLTVESWL